MSSWMLLRLLGTLALVAGVALVTRILLKRTFPSGWRRFGKRAYLAGVGALALGLLAWIGGAVSDARPMAIFGIYVVASVMVISMLLLLTAPFWAGVPALIRRFVPAADEPDPGRRAFLGRAAGSLPVAAAVSGPVGSTASMLAPVVREIEIPVRNLPGAHDGLKILQMTDVHLGTFIDVDQVESAIESARPHAPDLVALTGDIADDYSKLPATLELANSLAAPLGTHSIFGNHEVYRGLETFRRLHVRHAVNLMVGSGVLLEHHGEPLWLCGADDPATLGREHRPFLARTVQDSLADCPEGVRTRILLSHRPEGFEEAARQGVTLTLAGHTHGAQASFFGRSWLEPLMPKSYLLGHYQQGDSHLYTSAGLGHWFPFRLNCPCEVALVTLRRAAP